MSFACPCLFTTEAHFLGVLFLPPPPTTTTSRGPPSFRTFWRSSVLHLSKALSYTLSTKQAKFPPYNTSVCAPETQPQTGKGGRRITLGRVPSGSSTFFWVLLPSPFVYVCVCVWMGIGASICGPFRLAFFVLFARLHSLFCRLCERGCARPLPAPLLLWWPLALFHLDACMPVCRGAPLVLSRHTKRYPLAHTRT